MEAYVEFRTILYKWVYTVASLTGHDIFNKIHKITAYTMLTVLIGLLVPVLYTWTIYNYDGDLRLCAIAYYGTGIQVK